MAEKQYFVTEEGLAALEKELEYLKTVRRKEVAEKMQLDVDEVKELMKIALNAVNSSMR